MGTLLRSPTMLKLVKYSTASAAGVVVGQVTLVACLELLEWSALSANLASVTLGCIPNYTINRYWTWQQSGQNRLWGEVVPFWAMAALGALLSTLAVTWADRRWDSTLVLQAANLAGFGLLWVAKFLILDRLMWKVVHDLHPEIDVDAAEAGLPGALALGEAEEAGRQTAGTNGTPGTNGAAEHDGARAAGPNGAGVTSTRRARARRP